jgi:hypothetical protein
VADGFSNWTFVEHSGNQWTGRVEDGRGC